MAFSLSRTSKTIKDKFFEAIHGNNLVYNVCWEDPRLDREALQFDTTSRVVMISSAGCNALDYLLDNPAEIHCIDMNPRQNALLELKIRLIERGNFDDLFLFFGKGAHPEAKKIYRSEIRQKLSPSAKAFWDLKIDYFEPKKNGKTFLYRGTSGSLAWLAHLYFKRHKKLRTLVHELFSTKDLEKQVAVYETIEPKLWNTFINWILDQQVTMTLMGVPDAQKKMIEQYPGGMGSYIKDGFRNVFTKLPVTENYFWYGYIFGEYSETCAPEYLKRANFETLRARVNRIQQHTTTYADFLKRQTEPFSHFILLDHQDWMAMHTPEALVMEWTHILEKAKPGARFILRSASANVDFIPFFVHEKAEILLEKAADLHKRDRVGTYASTVLGVIR